MIEYVAPVTMQSPCVGICVIDENDTCEGCARTLDEIAEWTSMGEERRAAVMAELPGRRAI